VKLSRRHVLGRLAAAAGASSIASLSACRRMAFGECAGLSGARIRWVVPYAPGGGYDAETRLLEPYLERRLGADIVVDNQPGAGGIAGARAIASAQPDGRTLGTIGVPGLLVATMLGNTDAPNPARDFTVLGRISRSWHVWASGQQSPLRSIDDVIARSATRPLTFAINEAGSASLVAVAESASLLGISIDLVAGFTGTRAACLAAIRGDVDLVCYNYDTIRDLIASGDLVTLLQVSTAPVAPDKVLERVPVLGGARGLAVERARARGTDVERARTAANALIHVVGSGRIVVGPPRLPAALADCLSGVLYATLTSAELGPAGHGLDAATSRAAEADVEAAALDAPQLVPAVAEAMRALRQ
jgi:tripartite-type tricarboxylate transporter receptor subunit TctC